MSHTKALQGNIIKLLELESLSDEKKFALVEKMVDLIEKRFLVRILESVNEEQFQALDAVENDEAWASAVKEYVPNMDEILEEEVKKLKEELVESVKGDENLA
ncbi:MAG: DUF5663 domain-containing protein [Patescibacteria group bacterium]